MTPKEAYWKFNLDSRADERVITESKLYKAVEKAFNEKDYTDLKNLHIVEFSPYRRYQGWVFNFGHFMNTYWVKHTFDNGDSYTISEVYALSKKDIREKGHESLGTIIKIVEVK